MTEQNDQPLSPTVPTSPPQPPQTPPAEAKSEEPQRPGEGLVTDPNIPHEADTLAPPSPEAGDPEPMMDTPGEFNFRRYQRLGLSSEQLQAAKDKFDALSREEKTAENARIAGLIDSDLAAEAGK
jgi:hypothetical protein